MRKVQKISEIEPTINFTEFDFYNSFKKSFLDSELGKLYSSFPMQAIADACKLKSSSHLGRKSYFTPAGKIALMILKAYTNASDFELLNHLNSNIHYQLFCGIRIHPEYPLTNFKIISDIRCEIGNKLNINQCQHVLADFWKPYLRPIVRGKETKSVEFGAKSNNIQVDGISFIQHISFDAFHEGILAPDSIMLQQQLFHKRVFQFAGDKAYGTNKNRKWCNDRGINTSFVRKGKAGEDEKQKSQLRSILGKERATRLEGSFGTQKQFYSLQKIKAKTKQTELLWIFFGIHTTNAVTMIDKIDQWRQKQNKSLA